MALAGLELIKQLAHNDKSQRDQAVDAMSDWILKRDNVEEADMMKVWKGIFYCYWMSDKPLVQHELAGKLAALLHKFPLDRCVLYVKCFWVTMSREWNGIDRLRYLFYN